MTDFVSPSSPHLRAVDSFISVGACNVYCRSVADAAVHLRLEYDRIGVLHSDVEDSVLVEAYCRDVWGDKPLIEV